MTLNKFTALLLICLVLAAPVFADTVRGSLKKDSVRGMKGGEMTTITAAELGASFEAVKKGPFYEIQKDNTLYKVRISDVALSKEHATKRKCLPGEKTIIAENTSIGGTQMGSGQYGCE